MNGTQPRKVLSAARISIKTRGAGCKGYMKNLGSLRQKGSMKLPTPRDFASMLHFGQK
jgi:hypothetical protein